MDLLPPFIGGMGLLLMILAVPMMAGRVPPNSWYGFRIRLTLENPHIWYPVNAWSGKWLLRLGALCALTGLAMHLLPASWLEWVALGITVIMMAGVLALLILGSRMARALAQKAQAEPPRQPPSPTSTPDSPAR